MSLWILILFLLVKHCKVIPKFETLELLSLAYKQDLNAMFLKYRKDGCSYFYEIKNRNKNTYEYGFCIKLIRT